MQQETRNLISFVAVALLLLLAYNTFIIGPRQKQMQAQQAAASAAAAQAPSATGPAHLTRAQGLAQGPRVIIDTPTLEGSVALTGAHFDDLFLKQYKTTVGKDGIPVEVLRPAGTQYAYFASLGWIGANLPGIPTDQSVWTVTSGRVLTPTTPVTLTYAGAPGLTFTRTLAVDDKYMFTVTDAVTNNGAAPISLTPYGSVQRQDVPPLLGKNNIVHEGALGVLGGTLQEEKYSKWKKDADKEYDAGPGWFGVTDKYWMTVLIPPAGEAIKARAQVTPVSGVDIYSASYTAAQPLVVQPGKSVSQITHVFAGAKTYPVLTGYKKSMNLPRFEDAIDWGHLFFLTKPMFLAMDFFYHHVPFGGGRDPVTGQMVGNVGIAILLLTICIRVLTFPLALPGQEMGVKMRKIQPALKEAQAKYKDDPQALQKETMALYAREKINPITGCIPSLLPIPIFYSLTKLFTVTILIWHAPFFGWIHDLSARDPTSIVNLFGLLPFNPATVPGIGSVLDGPLHIGAWPLAYGLVTWMSMSMTPTTGMDPTQAQVMKLMPVFFTFILAQYTVGLLIYWTFSGIFTIVQQYVLMRRYKSPNPIDNFIARIQGKQPAAG